MRRDPSKFRLFIGLSAALVLSLVLAPQVHADSETVFKRLLKSTGWINCPQPDGGNSWGTCWVVDRQDRLVVTNKHVIDKATSVTVDFPLYERGKLLTSVTDYIPQAPCRGSVVYFDERRDLALCRLDAMPADIAALPLAAGSAPGQRVYSLGNSTANTPNQKEAKLWHFLAGKVELRYFDVVTFTKPPIQRVEATSLRCSMKTAPGDSGGPVVNTHGQVVAVHSNADRFNSFSIDVSEVKLVVERSMQRRRPPASERDLAGTWTLATKDELGRVYFSLTLCPDGSCEIYREEQYRGRFQRVRDNTVRVSVPGMHMDGETILTWSNDDQFSFTLGGMEFTATRR